MTFIETPRLLLRGWTDADARAWAGMNGDPRVMEYFVSTTPVHESLEAAERLSHELDARGYGWFIMERKDRPGFAGVLAICDIHWETPFMPRREIGWRLPVESWGQGFASEGAAALLDYARDTLQWDEVVAFTAVLNERSQRVMRRIGMTHDPADDFLHPRVPPGHRIQPHVLYRKKLR
jgi:RimJ/RimL family protein N-acetyltransferase